jgi:ABC-type dipeptide/oligopeptide/nickel transport system permease component
MHLAKGDFGRSIVYRQDVLGLVMDKFSSTACLGASALLIAFPIGTFMGIVGAVKQNSWIDKCFMTFSYAGISMPIFWLGMLLILLFSQTLGWLPTSGMHSPTGSGIGDVLKHLILPAFTLSLVPMSVVARMMRSAMLEVIHQDYIRTARAKGCSPFRVIVSHALRNSMIPVVTIFGIEAGYVIGGTVIVETVFSWPGVGQMLLNSILSRDFPLVVGGTLILAVIFVGINIIVDLLYNLIDPRIELKS